MSELVVWIDNPEAGRVNVWVQEGVWHSGEDCKVVLDGVVHLHSILKEKCQTLDVVGNIVFHCGVGDVMESAGSVVWVVDSVTPNIAGVHGSRDMEMYRVPVRIFF